MAGPESSFVVRSSNGVSGKNTIAALELFT